MQASRSITTSDNRILQTQNTKGETWTTKEYHKRKLYVLEMSVLHKILDVTMKGEQCNVHTRKTMNVDYYTD